jgi:site-specific DNA recombinase
MTTRVVGYVRVSTIGQARDGFSLDAQRKRITDYCTLQGLVLVGIEADEGVSAKSIAGRSGFKRALGHLEAGTASGIVACKLDRITRSLTDLSHLIEKYFQKYSLISLQEQIDTTSAAGRLILNILTSVSSWEREMAGERTNETFEHIRSTGVPAGRTPLGWSRDSGGKCIRDEQGQRAIARMVELRASMASYRDIANILEREGYKPKAAEKWNHVSIRKVILRQCVCV